MTGFDWLVLALVPVAVYVGARLGFVVASSSFGGFAVGLLVGLAAAPPVVRTLAPGPVRALVALALVLGTAVLCQAAGSYLGSLLHRHITGLPAQRLDVAFGVVGALVTLFGAAWLVGAAAEDLPDAPFASSVRDSRLVSVMSATVPLDSQALLASFGSLVDRSGFPAVFSDAGMERIDPVPPPDPAVLSVPGVRMAAASMVKVVGDAEQCGRNLEGSGFVVAPGRVLTNAHVVAGTGKVQVFRSDSLQGHPAEVVLFDPKTDVAVLAVPGLVAPSLIAGPELHRGDAAVVLGYPGDGPLNASPARVRGHLTALGQDIYGAGSVERSVYALRATVRSGNSGGPLLDSQGRFVGLVFAASVDDPTTGYALTPSALAADLAAIPSEVRPVSTRTCTP